MTRRRRGTDPSKEFPVRDLNRTTQGRAQRQRTLTRQEERPSGRLAGRRTLTVMPRRGRHTSCRPRTQRAAAWTPPFGLATHPTALRTLNRAGNRYSVAGRVAASWSAGQVAALDGMFSALSGWGVVGRGLARAHLPWVAGQAGCPAFPNTWEAPVFSERTSVGLDVHARSVVAHAVDGVTGEVFTARLVPDPGAVVAWLGQLPGPVATMYEAGPTGFGLARRLRAEGCGARWRRRRSCSGRPGTG